MKTNLSCPPPNQPSHSQTSLSSRLLIAGQPSPDARIDAWDQKWSDRFNRLEALLLARSMEKPEPTFQTVKITPAHTPQVGFVKATNPFLQPVDRPQSLSLSASRLTNTFRFVWPWPLCSAETGYQQIDQRLTSEGEPTNYRFVWHRLPCCTTTGYQQIDYWTGQRTKCFQHGYWLWKWQNSASLSKKASCLTRIQMSMLQTLTRPFPKNKLTEKLWGGSGHSWVGHTSLSWTLPLQHQMTNWVNWISP